jgi:hypothetical protein
MAMAVPARTATRFELCPPRPTETLTCMFALAIGTVREPSRYWTGGMLEVCLKGLIRDHLLDLD